MNLKNIKATGEVDPVLSRFSQQLSKEFISIYSEKVSYDVLVKSLIQN